MSDRLASCASLLMGLALIPAVAVIHLGRWLELVLFGDEENDNDE